MKTDVKLSTLWLLQLYFWVWFVPLIKGNLLHTSNFAILVVRHRCILKGHTHNCVHACLLWSIG